MRLGDFEDLVRRLTDEVPPSFLDGIADIAVSPRTVPHPLREEIYTLGECVPLPAAPDDGGRPVIQSRIVLYHGSFKALARLDGAFDWREEIWETLTHELRHHLEWRASEPALEALDAAAEQNFARQDGEPFDPGFFLDGEQVVPRVYRIEGDYFLDRQTRRLAAEATFSWHGQEYEATVPADATLPAFLTVDGVAEPPPGELVLVLRRRPTLAALLRRSQPYTGRVIARPLNH